MLPDQKISDGVDHRAEHNKPGDEAVDGANGSVAIHLDNVSHVETHKRGLSEEDAAVRG